MSKSKVMFTIDVRYYSSLDNKLVKVVSVPVTKLKSLKNILNLNHMKGEVTVDLPRSGTHDTHPCNATMRTNIMVRDAKGNLIKWKHLVK